MVKVVNDQSLGKFQDPSVLFLNVFLIVLVMVSCASGKSIQVIYYFVFYFFVFIQVILFLLNPESICFIILDFI